MSTYEHRARAVWFERESDRIVLDLTNGTAFSFPRAYVEGLEDAPFSEIEKVTLAGGGYAIHWEAFDIDLGVPELIAGIFGTRKWMAKLKLL